MEPDSVRKLDSIREKIEAIEKRNEKRYYLSVLPENSVEVNKFIFDECEGRLATASGVDRRDWIEVLYHWCIDHEGIIITVRVKAMKPFPKLPSVGAVLAGAEWIEREINDLLGVEFEGHPDPRRLILADDWDEGYPLRRDWKPGGSENE